MSKVFCDKPFNHNYIHPNGKMRLCCTTVQDLPTDNNYNLFDANTHSSKRLLEQQQDERDT